MKLTKEQILAYHLAHNTMVEIQSSAKLTAKNGVLSGVETMTTYQSVNVLDEYNEFHLLHFEDIKLKLRPLSSLTKPITVEGYNDGKEFVPLDLVGKSLFGKNYIHFDPLKKGFKACFNTKKGRVFVNITKPETMEFLLINLLLSWNFNLFLEDGEFVEL